MFRDCRWRWKGQEIMDKHICFWVDQWPGVGEGEEVLLGSGYHARMLTTWSRGRSPIGWNIQTTDLNLRINPAWNGHQEKWHGKVMVTDILTASPTESELTYKQYWCKHHGLNTSRVGAGCFSIISHCQAFDQQADGYETGRIVGFFCNYVSSVYPFGKQWWTS